MLIMLKNVLLDRFVQFVNVNSSVIHKVPTSSTSGSWVVMSSLITNYSHYILNKY